MIFGVLGIIALGWVGWGWLSGEAVQGWTSLAALILVIGSVQLLVLGVFGEYLGRMYMETKNRPLFIVDEIRSRERARSSENPVHSMNARIDEAYREAG